MAKANGYTCDNPECNKFEVGDVLPPGWVVLQVFVEKGVPGQDRMELCSNYCLAKIAVARTEADGRPIGGVKRGKRIYKSEESKLRAQENGRRTNHMRYHLQKGVLVEDCTFCQEITAPSNA